MCIALETRFVSVFWGEDKEARFLEFALKTKWLVGFFFLSRHARVFFVGVGFDREVNRETHIRKKEFCLSS